MNKNEIIEARIKRFEEQLKVWQRMERMAREEGDEESVNNSLMLQNYYGGIIKGMKEVVDIMNI